LESTTILVTWISCYRSWAILLAVFVSQTAHIALDDAKGFGFGLGDRLNSLPM
jgi:hypothetical protein